MRLEETYTDHNGLVWCNQGPQTDDHLAFGGHEPGIVAIGKALLPQRGVFLDVGAHVGLWSLNLADKAREVWSIEANPATFEVLRTNIASNRGVLTAMIYPRRFAAWDHDVWLKLVDANGKETGGSTRCEEAPAGNGAVSGGALDNLLAVYEVEPDLIKIDVEGAEARVLRGLSECLSRHRPVLIIEMHDHIVGAHVRDETLAELTAQRYVWSDDTRFSESYYVIARPKEQYDDDEGVSA